VDTRHVFLSIALWLPTNVVASIDTIIPQPKQIKRTGQRVVLRDAVIALASQEKKLRIAGEEVNERIAELGGQSLPIRTWPARSRGDRVFILHAGNKRGRALIAQYGLRVTPERPGEQGYVIAFRRDNGRTDVFLAGSDAQGALYAAVTFRHLIAHRGSQLTVEEAEIVDWPDFKLRQIGVPFALPLRRGWYALRYLRNKKDPAARKRTADEYFEVVRPYIDWLLRHKSNFMDPQPAAWAAPPETLDRFQRVAIRRVNQYALDRGIGTFYYESTCIGRYPRDKDNPDFKDVLFNKGHKRYFCWSRLDYHRRKAQAIAQVLRDCAYSGFFLHDVDSGGWKDPALWSRRCARCRRTYGNDHVKANLAVFGTYYREIKRLVPDIKFVAVIYPYSPNYLNPDWLEQQIRDESGEVPGIRKTAEELAAKYRRFLRRMGEGLPPDIYICVRENTRPNIDLIRSVYGRRPFQLYFEYAYWKGWRPQFIMSPRWTKTFYYPGIDDIMYGNNSLYNYNPLTQMYGLECAWNTEGPEREYFPSRAAWMDPRTCLEPREGARRFVEKACRDFWGGEAGPFFVPVFMGNLSFYFIDNPDEIARRCGLTDVRRLMREQADAATAAARSMDELWQKAAAARAQGRKLLSDYAYPYFIDFYKLTAAARVMGRYKADKMAIANAVIAGDMPRAERQIAAARVRLEQAEKDLAQLRTRLKGGPSFAAAYRKGNPFGNLFSLDVRTLVKDLERLDAGKQKLFESFNIPKWFRRTAERRRFEAAPVKEPIRIDGALDESAWGHVAQIEHFVNYRMLRLASLETTCRVLYDSANIYFGFECIDPNAKQIRIPSRERDDYKVVDSVEIFLDPNRTRKTFYHWVVDAGGNVFDAARTQAKDGTWKYSTDFDSKCKFAVQTKPDRWTAEVAIPLAEIGARPRPGRAWGFNVCRNIVHTHAKGEHESVAAGFMGGKSFHSVERFPVLAFASQPVSLSPPEVLLRIRKPVFKRVTAGEGQASEIVFNAQLETTGTLHDVTVAADAFVGDRRVGAFTVLKSSRVELMWRSLRPISFRVNEVQPGVDVLFAVRAKEGTWRFRCVFGSPPRRKAAAPRFVPGVDGKALASATYFPAFHAANGKRMWHIRPEEGTIDFWIRPNWTGATQYSPLLWMKHVLLDMGPVRYEYPYLANTRSIVLYHNAGGGLTFSITNRSYKSRTTSADIRRWRKGEWHHVACQWRISDGKCDMDIFLDGKKTSGKVAIGKPGKFEKEEEALSIQIGAMNTGVVPGDAAIDNLRISNCRRWNADFEPERNPRVDRQTTIMFCFEGDLRGRCPDGETVEARPGNAG